MLARLAVSLCVLFIAGCGDSPPEKEAAEEDSIQGASTRQRIPERTHAEGRDDTPFMFCTIKYSFNGSYEPLGFGWATDYPDSGFNLIVHS